MSSCRLALEVVAFTACLLASPAASIAAGDSGADRPKSLDAVLLIDGASSRATVEDVQTQIGPVMRNLHRWNPVTRVGLVVFGDKSDPIQKFALTLMPEKLERFLGDIKLPPSLDPNMNCARALETATSKTDWRHDVRRVVVLLGSFPPDKTEFASLLRMVYEFHKRGGEFDAIDVAALELGRHGPDLWGSEPYSDVVAALMNETRAAYYVLAHSGGGYSQELKKDEQIGQVLVQLLVSGEKSSIPLPPEPPPRFGPIPPAHAEPVPEQITSAADGFSQTDNAVPQEADPGFLDSRSARSK
jgi:hypothetical protein